MALSSVGLVCDQRAKGLNPCREIKQQQPENLSILALHCNYLLQLICGEPCQQVANCCAFPH